MTALLKIVPAWIWSALAGLLLVALVGGVQQIRVAVLQVDLAAEQAAHSEYRARVMRETAEAATAAREEERRRQTEIEGIRDAARGELERASADARDADQRADGLQREVARLRAGRAATCNTIAAQRGEAAGSTFGVLADLLLEVERAGRAMAAEADRRGIAGAACERAYDALGAVADR